MPSTVKINEDKLKNTKCELQALKDENRKMAKLTQRLTQELKDLKAPNSLKIQGEGKGGIAGFAKGGADVHLAEDGKETILSYTASAQVGGKIAQLGSRLIQSTAAKLADKFFANLKDQLAIK